MSCFTTAGDADNTKYTSVNGTNLGHRKCNKHIKVEVKRPRSNGTEFQEDGRAHHPREAVHLSKYEAVASILCTK